MSDRKPAPTKDQVADAIHLNVELDKVAALRPKLEDYVSEGVIDHVPEGKFSVPVDGARVLKMNEQANNLAAWYGDNRAESPERRRRREEREEVRARKTHRARASIVVPELPWKRKKESA